MFGFFRRKKNAAELCTEPKENSADTKTTESEQQHFDRDFHSALTALEKKLHFEENPEKVTMEAIKAACEFYDADWCGILIADKETRVWSAAVWYDERKGEMSPTLFHENEFFEYFPRWVDALKSGEPLVVSDVEALKQSDPAEYAHYKRLEAHSVIGAPFGERPTGFLVVRNAKRYDNIPDFLQMMAFVGLSNYYLQEMLEEMRMLERNHSEDETDADGIRINLFGTPEIVTAMGSLSANQYKSVKGWKLLTYLALKGKAVPVRTIAGDIWPDDNLDSQSDNIRGLIYRFQLKLTFLNNHLITSTTQGYRLNPQMKISLDTQEFESLWNASENIGDLRQKVKILKRATKLYQGAVYKEHSDEQWLMTERYHYEMMYLKVVGSLMEALHKLDDYPCIEEYATEALSIMPENSNAYYWMIAASARLGGIDMAKKELEIARQHLGAEEYQELTERLADVLRKT